MKPTTLRAAVAAGATVILRGHNRAYSPGATAFRLAGSRCLYDPPGLAAYFTPVVWRDDGWRAPNDWRGPYAAFGDDEIVTVLE